MSPDLVDRVLTVLGENAPVSRQQVECVLDALEKIHAQSPEPTPLSDESDCLPLDDDEDGLTHMDFATFLALPPQRRDELALRLQDRNWDAIQGTLERNGWEWMIWLDSRIVRTSHSLENYPTIEDIMTLGNEMGNPPLVFVRNPVIEEVAWTSLSHDDWYPTLPIHVGEPSWDDTQLIASGLHLISDFDTGTSTQLINADVLAPSGWISTAFDPRTVIRARHLLREYVYVVRDLRIGIASEAGTMRSGILSFRCVSDWQQSPLVSVNSQRQALVGRGVLLRLGLLVELNGANRSTRVPTRPTT